MRPPAVVEGQIAADGGSRLGHAVVSFEIHLLVFDAAPEPLDKYIVALGALAIHADRDVIPEQPAGEVVAGELAPLIGVEDPQPAIMGKGLLHSLDVERGLQSDRQPPGRQSRGPSGCR